MGRRRTEVLLALLPCLTFASASRATQPPQGPWTASTFPGLGSRKCQPRIGNGTRPLRLVCDPDGLLAQRDLAELDEAAERIDDETPCACPEQHHCREFGARGFSVAVAVVASLGLSSAASEAQRNSAAEALASGLRRTWALGQCSDDVVLFVSVDDKKVVTSLGQIAERRLPMSALSSIHSSSHALFSANRTAAGLRLFLGRFLQLLSAPLEDGTGGLFAGGLPSWAVVLLVLLCLLLLTGALVGGLSEYRRSKAAPGRGTGRRKRRRETRAERIEAGLSPVNVYGEDSASSDSDSEEEDPPTLQLTAKPTVRIA